MSRLTGFPASRLFVVAIVAAGLGYGVSASVGKGAAPPRLPAASSVRATPVTVHNCKAPSIDFVSPESGTTDNVDDTWVPVTGLSTTFHMGGKAPSCVIVEVSGDSYAQQATDFVLELVLDGGAGTSSPPYRYWATGDFTNSPREVRTGDFIFNNVAPGDHTISAQIQTFSGSAYPVYIVWPTMMILHR